jgi:hypothetical protein
MPLVTSGSDVAVIATFLQPEAYTYKAKDVVEHLLRGVHVPIPVGA